MEPETLTPEDRGTVAEQLGRSPRGMVAVASRCPAGHPSAVWNYPLHRRGDRLLPFPTIHWLTCPTLRRSVSRLEMGGLIGELDRRLATDPALAAALRADHRAYVAARWDMLTAADRAEVTAAGLGEVFHERGIGGLSHLASVKCLHLHYAHHLAAQNAIGALLETEFGIRPCPADSPGNGKERPESPI